MSQGRCKTCVFWGDEDDTSNAMCGVRACGKAGHGDGAGEPLPDGAATYAPDSFATETVYLYSDHVEPKFLTGPEFGCVHHQEKPDQSECQHAKTWLFFAPVCWR
jgi:hypothetical protein